MLSLMDCSILNASGELSAPQFLHIAVCLKKKSWKKVMDMLWFKFILGLNFISLCFKLIIIYYLTPKQKDIKFKPRIKLKNNRYT